MVDISSRLFGFGSLSNLLLLLLHVDFFFFFFYLLRLDAHYLAGQKITEDLAYNSSSPTEM